MISLFNDADNIEIGTQANLRFHNEEDVKRFIRTACLKMNLTESRILSCSRLQEDILPRYLIIWTVKKHSLFTLMEIGKFFNRDHSTIIHAIQKVDDVFEYHNKYLGTTTKEYEYYNFWYEYLLNY